MDRLRLPAVPTRAVEAAGDYVPYVPGRSELPTDAAERLLAFLALVAEEKRECE